MDIEFRQDRPHREPPGSGPAGRIELTDLELDTGGQAASPTFTITITVLFCSPKGTACGTCSWGTRACC